MNYQQSIAPTITAPRSHFDLSFKLKTTGDFDYLYPAGVMEIIPGATISAQTVAFARIPTLLHPLMDNAYLHVDVFWAPTRILWNNAKKFYGEQDNPGDSIDYTVPRMTAPATTGYGELSLADYFGLPTKIPDYTHISLPFRMYNATWNFHYRDQNLQDSVVVDLDDGPDTVTDYVLLKRNKSPDYFTSGLPNLLKDPAQSQTLPLGTIAPVIYDTISGTDRSDEFANAYVNGGGVHSHTGTATYNTAGTGLPTSSEHSLAADLSNATASTILQLRQAEAIQRILELDARAGTRFHEQIYAVYGVKPPFETYAPEFLGSARSVIQVQQTPQTSNDGTNGDVGDLSGIGLTVNDQLSFTKSFSEPGYLLWLVSAKADITYQQGMHRMWDRTDRYSFYHPYLQSIGDQATLCKEIVMQNPATDTGSTGTADNEKTFNYQERYAEYKYGKNLITGLFRSNCTASLESWHLSEEFTAALPAFDSTFIASNTPMDRAVATPSEPHMKIDIKHNIQAALPMHMYSIPGLGDRF